ncbi:N-acetylmuramoyl-L-alanine amidase [Alishewanella sp. SMS8]|uniref:N-acetylmuramoyl-L-alanine amidase n=1 Tax=Alishewanella sp. SMS8 TaxID=2994676 RepID=UPI0027416B4B|nr:N-acetylmuramoyl-L-alanine amidase [Alishewanella sp. SMS8]MDP4945106.1 N-acetylmuramoyl-L-alanine amidase [Alishewanella sp.]MDP5036804.1 N-acetylmuramoyl-L-alanine amidase [Alishewanella sp.]MDP5188129.1 N-acetylmuramoyl-L-alanine amidase [Alishewanella sp.]MDP5458696.1 N-acetylmuramoyl-L-alanine amidase [Alishewanella sp. SMS8]
MKKTNALLAHLILYCLLLQSAVAFASNQVQNIRIWPSPDNTRVVFDLSAAPEYKYFTLENPERLVIDLSRVTGATTLPAISGEAPLIRDIRSSGTKNTMRIVLDLSSAVKPTIFALTPTPPYGHRLVVDLPDSKASSSSASSAPVETRPVTNSSANTASSRQAIPATVRAARDIIIAIDAGHGGEDPGSIGPSGIYEKNLTLPIAKQLLETINREPGMKATMVRTGDYYVHVNSRTDIARRMQADLLVSIHADAFTSPQPKGASVWVLSLRRATSEVGRMLEQTERHGELLGGVAEVIKDSANERYLAQTVLDLSMNHSMVTAHQVANQVLSELGKVTTLHKKEPQAASLGVLRAPDIPSILVEVGFISNPQEERLLRSSSHQQKLVQSLFNGLRRHFELSPPADSLFAQRRSKEHRVQAGESLSLLAQRYNVSLDELRRHNELRNDSIRIGQVLRIP